MSLKKCFQTLINVPLLFFKKRNFKLEKKNFLSKKSIYFITYRNEHPVFYTFVKNFLNQISILKKGQSSNLKNAHLTPVLLQHNFHLQFFSCQHNFKYCKSKNRFNESSRFLVYKWLNYILYLFWSCLLWAGLSWSNHIWLQKGTWKFN